MNSEIYSSAVIKFLRDGTPPNGNTPELNFNYKTRILWDSQGPSPIPETQRLDQQRNGSTTTSYTRQAAETVFDNTPIVSQVVRATKMLTKVVHGPKKEILEAYSQSIMGR